MIRHRFPLKGRTVVFSAIFVLARPVAGQDETGLVQVSDRVWAWIATAEDSSNSALFVGDNSALIVDPGLEPSVTREFLSEVRKVTSLPIRVAVLTHWHPDHSFGALCLPERNFALASTPMTRMAIAENGSRSLQEPSPDSAPPDCLLQLPEIVVERRRAFDLGRHLVEVYPTGHGHTAGDAVVWSPQERVLVTGDLFNNLSCPYMEEADVRGWAETLDRLLRLRPEQVIPGHFRLGSARELRRFRHYLSSLIEQSKDLMARGSPLQQIPAQIDFSEFSDFAQYPQYEATFERNAAVVAGQVAPLSAGEEFTRLAVLDVGLNPHQIAFSANGRRAFVAAAGSDQVSVLDVEGLQVRSTLPVSGTPLGVIASEQDLIVSRFGAEEISLIRQPDGRVIESIRTGRGSSLFSGPLPNGNYFFSTEQDDSVRILDPGRFQVVRRHQAGRRPFPPASTGDGRLLFVPNYDDGTVTVIDLWNDRVVKTVPVGPRPSGGTLINSDNEYAVAVRGADRVAFINTASFKVTGILERGIGKSPFSVVTTPDGALAFVNNTASHDISVVQLPDKRVVARLPVGEVPIVMAVHPDGETLWVSSEGSHQLTVFQVPSRWRRQGAREHNLTTEVGVLGMIHSGHRTSRNWSLDAVRETIRKIRPDVVCAEIPPNRWQRIWRDYARYGVLEDSRIRVFPEYTDVLLPLKVEVGFTIEPCAAWTREMSDLRSERMRAFSTEPEWREQNRRYSEERAAVRARHRDDPSDDPFFIHSEDYDHHVREEYSIYDRYLNDWIGPGGWTNINEAHMALIDQVIRKYRGQRVLVTFGAAHKYWFLDALRQRQDVRLLDVRTFLPERQPQQQKEQEAHMDKEVREIERLHRFFQDWFTGTTEKNEENFARFSEVIAPEFEMIGPSGARTGRQAVIDRLWQAHGSRPDSAFQIEVRRVKSVPLGDGLLLVTYEEWQQSTAATSGRLTTALLRQKPGTPNNLEWVHVHETWLQQP